MSAVNILPRSRMHPITDTGSEVNTGTIMALSA